MTTGEPKKREFANRIQKTPAAEARVKAQETFANDEDSLENFIPHTVHSNSGHKLSDGNQTFEMLGTDDTLRISFDEEEMATSRTPEIGVNPQQMLYDPVDFESYLQESLREMNPLPELQVLWEIPKSDVVATESTREHRVIESPESIKRSEQADHYFRSCSNTFMRDWSTCSRTYGTFNGFEGFNRTQDKGLLCRRTPSFVKNVHEFHYPVDVPPGEEGESQLGVLEDSVLDEVVVDMKDWEEQDDKNTRYRKKFRHQSMFSTYPRKEDIRIEPRAEAKIPTEHIGTQLKIHVTKFEMGQKFEPLFGSLFLYDTREKRRVSENLYFDFNEEEQQKMLLKHIPDRAYETKAHAGIFSITNLHPDVFIIIRIEKVLEGALIKSLSEIYASEKLKAAQLEKLKAGASEFCDRLGKYRMPFAWYCVSMAKIFETKLKDRDAEKIPPLDAQFHCTVKLQCLILQDPERMKEEDLHKFCQELKRYEASNKAKPKTNFEYIKADIAIEVSTLVESDMLCVFTSDYARVKGPKEVKKRYRPVREIEEFPAKEINTPSVSFKNILYVYPHTLNLSNIRTPISARNIAIRVIYLTHEDTDSALNIFYGKSHSQKFYNESYAAVTYHNKSPDFYEEIKINMPAKTTEFSHILFQFFHITCQKPRKQEEAVMNQLIGVTWLPIIDIKTGMVNVGEFNLPLSSEQLPKDYSRSSPEIPLPSVRWIEGHKPLFRVSLYLQSTLYTLCPSLHNYFTTAFWADKLEIEPTPSEVISVIKTLPSCNTEQIFKFMHLAFDSLFNYLILEGPVANSTLEALAKIVHVIHSTPPADVDINGRNQKLASYVHFVFRTPQPISVEKKGTGRFLHEVLVELWINASDSNREIIQKHAWFYFELIVKSIVQYLNDYGKLQVEQATRFDKSFLENLQTLVKKVTESIIELIPNPHSEVAKHLSLSLSYFIHDLVSVINRTCILNMVNSYFRRFNQSTADATTLLRLKIEFLHVLCLHEYFVQLNLAMPEWWLSKIETQLIEEISLGAYSWEGGEQHVSLPSFIDLSENFFKHHYLISILLSTLRYVLSFRTFPLKSKMVLLVKDLIESHDTDLRYGKIRSYIAYLYLPLIGIAIDYLPILYTSADKQSKRAPRPASVFNMHGLKSPRQSMIVHPGDIRDTHILDPQTSKDFLFCVIWVLKNIDYSLKHHIFIAVGTDRLEALLKLLDICLDSFEYQGIEAMRTENLKLKPSEELRENLANCILGQESAVQQLRHQQANVKPGEKRWMFRNTRTLPSDKESRQQMTDGIIDTKLQSNIYAEVSLVILDFIEALIQEDVEEDDPNKSQPFLVPTLLPSIINLFLHYLRTNQSTYVLTCMCSSLRSLILKYPDLILFQFQEQCSYLCKDLLHHCSSSLHEVRQQATSTLYTIMRQHFILAGTFSYVKVQITSALSTIVGELAESEENAQDIYLRRSLNTLSKYARVDKLRDISDSSSFPDQVTNLSSKLLIVIDDTSKLRACGSDSEMLLDLMYRIAKSYQNSPDLRLTWLENMMNKNKEEGNYAEAGMCLVHAAAMIAEYLGKIEPKPYMPIGAVSFLKISPNVIEESAVSEDTVSAKEEGVCNSQKFAEEGLLGMLKLAHHSFEQAHLYEAVIEIDKVIIPVLEHNREYSKLARIHETMQNCYRTMDNHIKERKYYTSYYRVAFFGQEKFGPLHGEQFIYKCNTICKLSEFTQGMQAILKQKYGEENVKVITDSNRVDETKLIPDIAYIQVTFVEPYFDDWELNDRKTEMERSFNISRFVFSTPFTLEGKAHGDTTTQYMRRTILTTYNSFPYLKARVSVMDIEEFELTPIELGIEEIKKQTLVLRELISAHTVDQVLLDMRLSGAIATTVNQGPMAIAHAFLKPEDVKNMGPHERWLKIAFKDFMEICEESLKMSKDVNTRGDRIAYQRNLEKYFQAMKKELKPILENPASSHRYKHKRKERLGGQMLDRISGIAPDKSTSVL